MKKSAIKKEKKASQHACFKRALLNIFHHGDTDIFPYPIENKILAHNVPKTVELLSRIDADLDRYLTEMPPTHDHQLSSVGYSGFRAATQIDPIWNAYLLGLVIYLGQDIEKARIQADKDVIHSYRFNNDIKDKNLFQKEYGWRSFHNKANCLCEEFKYVVITDISDFYPRIYHHRLENGLKKCTVYTETVSKIHKILNGVSVGNVSYGLPVGGPASRILSELVLNNIDRLLVTHGIKFCRFVDDFRIFANSKEEAFGHLVFLAQKLLDNDGLSLQKNKTRIMSTKEYLATNALPSELDEEEENEIKSFLSVNIYYDPYSDNALDNYQELKNEISKFDIASMLSKEIRKSRIHESLTKQLLRAIRHINEKQKNFATETLYENLSLLAPVFPSVILLTVALLDEMDGNIKSKCFTVVRNLIASDDHIVKVPVNMAYAVKLLSFDNSDESDEVLATSYSNTPSLAVKHQVILAMAKHDSSYWISDRRRQYSNLTSWEQRAILIASYILDDEGSTWRKKAKKGFNEFEELIVGWASSNTPAEKIRELL